MDRLRRWPADAFPVSVRSRGKINGANLNCNFHGVHRGVHHGDIDKTLSPDGVCAASVENDGLAYRDLHLGFNLFLFLVRAGSFFPHRCRLSSNRPAERGGAGPRREIIDEGLFFSYTHTHTYRSHSLFLLAMVSLCRLIIHRPLAEVAEPFLSGSLGGGRTPFFVEFYLVLLVSHSQGSAMTKKEKRTTRIIHWTRYYGLESADWVFTRSDRPSDNFRPSYTQFND